MSRPAIAGIHPHSSPTDVAEALFRPAESRNDLIDWWTWPNVVEGFHLAVHHLLSHAHDMPSPAAKRGIAIVGGGKYFPSVYVTVRILRHVGCELPVEVWHFSGEENDALMKALAAYDVRFVNANSLPSYSQFRFLEGHWWKGWQLKAFALLNTSFCEVLLLDADCYPTRNPEYLFEWVEFQRTGAVFWPDIIHSPPAVSERACALFEVGPPSDRLTESGQLLLNREQVWENLVLTGFYNQCADLVYNYIWGDKDTFPFAWRRRGVPYGRMWPECMPQSDCLLQLDYHGHVIFQHRINDKFKLQADHFDSTVQHAPENRYHPELAHESFCFYVLNELRMSMGI